VQDKFKQTQEKYSLALEKQNQVKEKHRAMSIEASSAMSRTLTLPGLSSLNAFATINADKLAESSIQEKNIHSQSFELASEPVSDKKPTEKDHKPFPTMQTQTNAPNLLACMNSNKNDVYDENIARPAQHQTMSVPAS